MKRPSPVGLLFIASLFTVLGMSPTSSVAQDGDVPAILNYQGQLLVDGQPVNGSEEFSFAIVTSDGTPQWEQEYEVEVQEGVFSVLLGREGSDESLARVFEENDVLYLSVSTEGEEIDRIQFTASPYAFRAGVADAISEGGAVQDVNGESGSITLAASGAASMSQEGSTFTFSVDEETVVRSIEVEDEDTGVTGDITFRGQGNINIIRDGQEIIFRHLGISSERYKEDVQPIADALSQVQQLEGVAFTWKEDGQRDIGFIAEEVAPIVPEVIYYDEDGQVEGINYPSMVALLVEAAKEQQQTVMALEERVERLERLLDARAHGDRTP